MELDIRIPIIDEMRQQMVQGKQFVSSIANFDLARRDIDLNTFSSVTLDQCISIFVPNLC